MPCLGGMAVPERGSPAMPSGDSLTPEQRVTRAQLAAARLHATHDSRELTAPARRAFLARFEEEVDPGGTLAPEERQRRAEHAKRAYFLQLAFRSSKARRLRRNADALDAEVASSEQSADDSGPAGAEDPQGDLEGGEA